MIDASMIPDEVVEAMLRMVACSGSEERTRQRIHYRAAIAAALNAWEGGDVILNSKYNPRISLPIKENVNDRI